MTDPIIERVDLLREQYLEKASRMPEDASREFMRRYCRMMIDHSKESMVTLQKDLAHLLKIRDRHPSDMQAQELLWFNIQLTQDCIKQEAEDINAFREELKQWQTQK